MCNCSKNQTGEEIFEYLEEKGLVSKVGKNEHPGIGMFKVPAPELGILEYKTVYVEDLSYKECSKRGKSCVAFKWIPKGYTTEYKGKKYTFNNTQDILTFPCEGDSCLRGSCPQPCWCWDYEVTCHTQTE